MGADCEMANPDSWAVIAYFVTVALGITLSLCSRKDSQAMLSRIIQKLRKMRFKKRAVAMGGTLFLVYFNRLTRVDICVVSAFVVLLWMYGFSDWFTREALTVIERTLRALLVL